MQCRKPSSCPVCYDEPLHSTMKVGGSCPRPSPPAAQTCLLEALHLQQLFTAGGMATQHTASHAVPCRPSSCSARTVHPQHQQEAGGKGRCALCCTVWPSLSSTGAQPFLFRLLAGWKGSISRPDTASIFPSPNLDRLPSTLKKQIKILNQDIQLLLALKSS